MHFEYNETEVIESSLLGTIENSSQHIEKLTIEKFQKLEAFEPHIIDTDIVSPTDA